MPGQLFSRFYKPFQEHVRSAIFKILQTKSHAMSGQHASFFKEKCLKKYQHVRSASLKKLQTKSKSMSGQLFNTFYKPSDVMPGQHASFFRGKKIKLSMPGQLFSQIYKPSPRACQVSYFENFTYRSKSMPGLLVLEFY